jgi:hypothetical protein
MAEAARVVCVLNGRLQDDFGIGHATIQTEMANADACRVDPHGLYCALQAHAQGCDHSH